MPLILSSFLMTTNTPVPTIDQCTEAASKLAKMATELNSFVDSQDYDPDFVDIPEFNFQCINHPEYEERDEEQKDDLEEFTDYSNSLPSIDSFMSIAKPYGLTLAHPICVGNGIGIIENRSFFAAVEKHATRLNESFDIAYKQYLEHTGAGRKNRMFAISRFALDIGRVQSLLGLEKDGHDKLKFAISTMKDLFLLYKKDLVQFHDYRVTFKTLNTLLREATLLGAEGLPVPDEILNWFHFNYKFDREIKIDKKDEGVWNFKTMALDDSLDLRFIPQNGLRWTTNQSHPYSSFAVTGGGKTGRTKATYIGSKQFWSNTFFIVEGCIDEPKAFLAFNEASPIDTPVSEGAKETWDLCDENNKCKVTDMKGFFTGMTNMAFAFKFDRIPYKDELPEGIAVTGFAIDLPIGQASASRSISGQMGDSSSLVIGKANINLQHTPRP